MEPTKGARLSFSVIVQVLSMERSTGAMLLTSPDGKEGQIWVREGVLLHAVTNDGAVGIEALQKILEWTPGSIHFLQDSEPPDVSIGRPLEEVMLEVVAGMDESNWEDNFNFSVIEYEGGKDMAAKNMERVLDALAALSGFEGAAVVSDEGLILASKFVKKYAQDKVAALVSETLNLAKKVVTEADWGDLDNMIIESEAGSKMVIYKTNLGFVVLIGSGDLNLGLARVTVDEAAETLDKG